MKRTLLVLAAIALLGALPAPRDEAKVVTALVTAGLSNAQSDFRALRRTYHGDADYPYYDTTENSDACRYDISVNHALVTCGDDCAKVRHEVTRAPFQSDNWQLFCGGRTIAQPLEVGAETLRRAIAAVVPAGFVYDRKVYTTPSWLQMIWTGPSGVSVLLEIERSGDDQAHYDVAVVHA